MNRAPTMIWCLRKLGHYPFTYVATAPNDQVQVVDIKTEDATPDVLLISRADARLLATRLNQCLDQTRKI